MNRFGVGLFVLLPLACVKPPDVVLVDRATALEQQAGGSLEDIEQGLAQHAVSPSPTPLTPDQLPDGDSEQALAVRLATAQALLHVDREERWFEIYLAMKRARIPARSTLKTAQHHAPLP